MFGSKMKDGVYQELHKFNILENFRKGDQLKSIEIHGIDT